MATSCCRWPSPGLALLAMCVVGFVLMLDRGIISSNGVGGTITSPDGETMVTRFNLTLFQSGCIPAVYFVGVSIGSPVVGLLSSKFPVSKLIGSSFVVWGISQLVCGFSANYAMLLIFRFFVGLSGGTISLLPVVVDDVSPPKYVGLWLGIYFVSIPLGFAAGYIAGGAIGTGLSWRAAFWILAGISVPLAAFFLFTRPLDLSSKQKKVTDSSNSTGTSLVEVQSLRTEPREDSTDLGGRKYLEDDVSKGTDSHIEGTRLRLVFDSIMAALGGLGREVRGLLSHPVGVMAVLGLGMWNAYLSTAAWWGPKATLELYYNNSSDKAETVDFIFGAIAAATGVVGTLLGGAALDVGRPASLKKGLWLSSTLMAAVTVLGVVTFGIIKVIGAYWGLLTVLELTIFAVQSPAYSAAMAAVPATQRPFVLAAVEAIQHLLGDIPGPPIFGAIQNSVENWHLTLALLSIASALGATFFLVGVLLSRNRPDYTDSDGTADEVINTEEGTGNLERGGGVLTEEGTIGDLMPEAKSTAEG